MNKMKYIKKILIFSLILFVGFTAVSATDIIEDDSSAITVETPQVDQSNEESFAQESVQETDNNEDETQTYTGRTYNNPITITPSNYGTQMSNIYSHDAVEFSGTFDSSLTNGVITITSPIVFTTTSSATFEDTQFVINSDDVTINGLTIVNDDGTNGAAISATGYNNIEVLNNYISITKTTHGETVGIKFNNTNNQVINGNTIVMNVFPQYRWEIIHHEAENPEDSYDEYIFHLNNSAIVVDNSYDVDIEYNKIFSYNSTITEFYGTNEGLNIRNSHIVNVNYNNVTISNGDYGYGITFENTYNSNINYNKIEVTTPNYADGIQLVDSKTITATYNNITATARNATTPHNYETVAYGVYMSTNWGEYKTYDNIISNNKIEVSASVTYGIEGYITRNNTISNNIILATGNCSMGIGLYNSSKITITGNTITVTGATRTLNAYFYEMIPPVTTGIKTLANENSVGNTIENNNIYVSDPMLNPSDIYAIILEDSENTVSSSNTLNSGSNTGRNAVNYVSGNHVFEDDE